VLSLPGKIGFEVDGMGRFWGLVLRPGWFSRAYGRFQTGLTFLTCLCFANSSTVSLFIKTHIE
jgi:hypothetical protein